MLRSSHCVLAGKDEAKLARLGLHILLCLMDSATLAIALSCAGFSARAIEYPQSLCPLTQLLMEFSFFLSA